MTLLAILCFSVTVFGCAQQPQGVPVAEPRLALPPPPPPPKVPSEAELRAAALHLGAGDCSDLRRIRHLESKAGLLGFDKYYNRIYVHPAEYRACLIDSLSDTTEIPPVDSGPNLQINNVADMAWHMLGDMDLVPENDCIPQDVRKQMKTYGVFAFHEWRDAPENRRKWVDCVQRYFVKDTRVHPRQ